MENDNKLASYSKFGMHHAAQWFFFFFKRNKIIDLYVSSKFLEEYTPIQYGYLLGTKIIEQLYFSVNLCEGLLFNIMYLFSSQKYFPKLKF